MLNNKKIIVVLPAYNASKTLEKTFSEIPSDVVDDVLLIDDKSKDNTIEIAKELNIKFYSHESNLGYGGNQKTCYRLALENGADIVVMLHPDYQYSPKLIPSLAGMIAYGEYDVVFGSRIIGGGALKGGMPLYKYFFNRILTFIQNLLMGLKLSEYHTGYRAYSRLVLESLNLNENSNDFIFDNQIIGQIVKANFRIGELSCPTRYDENSSSINFQRSVKYGLGVLAVSIKIFFYRISKINNR
ncbi:MAG: glycosyltransferase family 2 protein [Proteobacteria bacterium]|nr:glycosyltransferase family 2 protein [Pseudomonadota bacterium]